VNSPPRHRRPQTIRRQGRHAAPSQIENVAGAAARAAPAVAIAGMLVATGPNASAAVTALARPAAAAALSPAGPLVVHHQPGSSYAVPAAPASPRVHARPAAASAPAFTDALVVHHEAARYYTVQPGDTLSSIALRYYGTPAAWQWLYQANRSVVRNPGEIYAGQVLDVPYGQPAPAVTASTENARPAAATASSSLSGTLGCSGLEQLWEEAGGSSGEAFMAAEIAEAESSGRQYALSPTNDYGYWQINGVHGPAEATFNPIGNARAAIAISDDGTTWNAWTTYTSGAYEGRC
jgi:hypothetical protein